jgi:carboxyvinyl-carboxyphosphonate phosphorylmutase
MSERAAALRSLVGEERIIVAPGAYDALSARLVEQAGFPVTYVTGAGVASSRLGVPDIGLTTMSEVLDTAKSIVHATKTPVICDTDTGYGNPINVTRTVREFEAIEVAAIQIEDQIMPKKCGHTEGKQLLSKREMLNKIDAFRYARKSEDFMLIARTDAIAVYGFDDAMDRARAYAEAGADVLFVEAPRTIEEMEKIPRMLEGVPCLVNMVEGGGKTPIRPVHELEAMGYRIAIFPVSAWMAAIKAIQGVLDELKAHGSTDGFAEHMVSFREMFEVVGLSGYRALEDRLLDL